MHSQSHRGGNWSQREAVSRPEVRVVCTPFIPGLYSRLFTPFLNNSTDSSSFYHSSKSSGDATECFPTTPFSVILRISQEEPLMTLLSGSILSSMVKQLRESKEQEANLSTVGRQNYSQRQGLSDALGWSKLRQTGMKSQNCYWHVRWNFFFCITTAWSHAVMWKFQLPGYYNKMFLTLVLGEVWYFMAQNSEDK